MANCFSSRLACLYTRFLYRNCEGPWTRGWKDTRATGAWRHPSLPQRSHGRRTSRGWRSSSSRPRAWSRQQTRTCLPHPALGSLAWQSRCPCCHPGTLGDIRSLKSSTSSELDTKHFALTWSVPKRNVRVSVCLEAQHPPLVPGPRAPTPLRADVEEPRLNSGEGQQLARTRIPGGGTCSEPSPSPVPPAVAGHLPRLRLAS